MAGTRKVSVYVHAHVRDKDGSTVQTVVLKPGDTVPDGVELGEQCFVEPEAAAEAATEAAADKLPAKKAAAAKKPAEKS